MSTPDPGVVFCSSCGRQNVVGSRFCNGCGASITIPPPSPVTKPPVSSSSPPTSTKIDRRRSINRQILMWAGGAFVVLCLLVQLASRNDGEANQQIVAQVQAIQTTRALTQTPTRTPTGSQPAQAARATAASTSTVVPTTAPTVRPTDITGVAVKAGNVRNIPGTDGSEVIGQLAAGDTVILRGRRTVGSDTWYQVTMPDGVWGWASGILLTVEEGVSAALPEPTPEPTPTTRTVGSIEEAEALVFCRNTLREALTSPATADFPFWGPDSSVPFGNRVTIIDHVDSQNGFGALVRTNYRCIVRFDWENNQKVIEELVQLE